MPLSDRSPINNNFQSAYIYIKFIKKIKKEKNVLSRGMISQESNRQRYSFWLIRTLNKGQNSAVCGAGSNSLFWFICIVDLSPLDLYKTRSKVLISCLEFRFCIINKKKRNCGHDGAPKVVVNIFLLNVH